MVCSPQQSPHKTSREVAVKPTKRSHRCPFAGSALEGTSTTACSRPASNKKQFSDPFSHPFGPVCLWIMLPQHKYCPWEKDPTIPLLSCRMQTHSFGCTSVCRAVSTACCEAQVMLIVLEARLLYSLACMVRAQGKRPHLFAAPYLTSPLAAADEGTSASTPSSPLSFLPVPSLLSSHPAFRPALISYAI